jgi:hypothetical protein
MALDFRILITLNLPDQPTALNILAKKVNKQPATRMSGNFFVLISKRIAQY